MIKKPTYNEQQENVLLTFLEGDRAFLWEKFGIDDEHFSSEMKI